MIYLDYSATTQADKSVLERFKNVCENYSANPNASHKLGQEAKSIIDSATKEITELLGIKPNEIIYTSGASESNNTFIKGVVSANPGNHIITTTLEHSSVTAPIGYLQSLGYKVDFVNLDVDGKVDVNHLKSLITPNTVLVSICAVNSETGIRNPIEEIGKILKEYPNTFFHTDMTQCLGKDTIDLTNVDAASFSAHKIYGIIGIGGLVLKENVKITPLIHGGKSTSVYRSGTPQTALISSLAVAMREIMPSISFNKKYIQQLNERIRNEVLTYDGVYINSPFDALPQILNISVLGTKADATQKFFEDNDIYISTKTACATNNDLSSVIYAITGDEEMASSSFRISLSHKTTEREVTTFLEVFAKYMREKDASR